MAQLLPVLVSILNTHEACLKFRTRWQLWGYVVVGSTTVLGGTNVDSCDVDVVLLSASDFHRASDTTIALLELNAILGSAGVLPETSKVWFVNATVNILKMQDGDQSMDILWRPGAGMENARC